MFSLEREMELWRNPGYNLTDFSGIHVVQFLNIYQTNYPQYYFVSVSIFQNLQFFILFIFQYYVVYVSCFMRIYIKNPQN